MFSLDQVPSWERFVSVEQGEEFWWTILNKEVKGIASSKCLKEATIAKSAVIRPQETGRADITTAQVGEITEEENNLAPDLKRIKY